jgi:hypothetical protein
MDTGSRKKYSPLVASMKTAAIADSVAQDIATAIVPHIESIVGINRNTEWDIAGENADEALLLAAQAQDIIGRLRALGDRARATRPS